jgi:hypothetical protein
MRWGSGHPAADLVDAAISVFRRLVREHPALFRITFQRVLPEFTPGPELVATRARALARLRAKVGRLDAAGQLGDTTIDEAVFSFQALCEGCGNVELRGNALPLLPGGGEEAMWQSAFTRLVRGFAGPTTPIGGSPHQRRHEARQSRPGARSPGQAPKGRRR